MMTDVTVYYGTELITTVKSLMVESACVTLQLALINYQVLDLVFKYQTRVGVADGNKHSSLLLHGINYCRKKFYGRGTFCHSLAGSNNLSCFGPLPQISDQGRSG